VAQTLSKAERGHAQDLLDVREMISYFAFPPSTRRHFGAPWKSSFGKWGGLDSNQRPRDYEATSNRLCAAVSGADVTKM
jgi:hypothetical protein